MGTVHVGLAIRAKNERDLFDCGDECVRYDGAAGAEVWREDALRGSKVGAYEACRLSDRVWC
jgi:hypothetical protein